MLRSGHQCLARSCRTWQSIQLARSWKACHRRCSAVPSEVETSSGPALVAIAPAETSLQCLAAILASVCQSGDCICLYGRVGAGKSVFRYTTTLMLYQREFRKHLVPPRMPACNINVNADLAPHAKSDSRLRGAAAPLCAPSWRMTTSLLHHRHSCCKMSTKQTKVRNLHCMHHPALPAQCVQGATPSGLPVHTSGTALQCQ